MPLAIRRIGPVGSPGTSAATVVGGSKELAALAIPDVWASTASGDAQDAGAEPSAASDRAAADVEAPAAAPAGSGARTDSPLTARDGPVTGVDATADPRA